MDKLQLTPLLKNAYNSDSLVPSMMNCSAPTIYLAVDHHAKQQKRDEIETILLATSISSITAAMRSRNSSPMTASGQSTPRCETPPTHQIALPIRQMTPPTDRTRVSTNPPLATYSRIDGSSKHADPIGNSLKMHELIILRPSCIGCTLTK